MMWNRVLPEFHHFAFVDRPLDVSVMSSTICYGCGQYFRASYGVWSDIVQRKIQNTALSVDHINKAWIKVNRALGRFIASKRAMVLRYKELEAGSGGCLRGVTGFI